MYNANTQNSIIRVRTELNECSYDPSMKDYLANLIVSIMNFPKKNTQVRHFIRNMGQNRIIMIWYPMSVPFAGKNYNVPLQIYIMRNVPYEPPQIFLEVVQGSAANPNNKDVDPNNNRIMTNSLRSWTQYSTMDNVMNEIYNSFSRVFPIYKKKSSNPQPQQPPYQGSSGGGGIYGMLVNEVKNMYNQNINNQNNNNQGVFGFQPPKQSIYGQAMNTGANNNYNNNNYNNNNYNNNYNNNQQQPQSFGGGIYGNNSNNNSNNNYNNNYNNNQQQQPQSFGGGIYGNNSNNNNNNNYNNNQQQQQQQPKSFGGGIYGDNNSNNNNYNNNNQQQQPNSFGGIYGNNNNNNNYNNNNYNNNNQNQYQNQFSGGINGQQIQNPDEDFKNILIEEVSAKISNKLIEEKKRLKTQNDKLNNYKTIFAQENQKLQNFVNNQNLIKTRCDEDMNNMANALNKINNQINQGKNMTLNEENCLKLVEVSDSNSLKIIAGETSIEEMILVVRKGFERKKISFAEAIMFMRNSTRDLFAVKFMKEKAINKYKY